MGRGALLEGEGGACLILWSKGRELIGACALKILTPSPLIDLTVAEENSRGNSNVVLNQI